MNIKEILGEDYSEDMTMSQLEEKLQDKNLVIWNDNKMISKSSYISLEERLERERNKRKEFEAKLSEIESANLTEAEKQKVEYDNLLNELNNMKLEKAKSDTKAMYSSMGYASDIVNELTEMDFYEGTDKLERKAEVLKRANDSLVAERTKTIMTSDSTPSVANSVAISKKDMYKAQLDNATSTMERSVIIGRALQDGITL